MKLKINKLTVDDVKAAFSAGFDDFRRVPMFGLFFGAIYAVGGIFITIALTYLHQPWMIIPVAIGFPLVGPFIAVGLYEVSRRREKGEDITWSGILREVFRQRERQLSWMAFVVLFIFWIWIYQVRLLMALFLGYRIPASLEAFATFALTTPEGLVFLAVGTVVGAVIATILFSITVISMPLLLDHDLDFITAMLTSIRAVAENVAPMLVFGLAVAVAALLALVPAFLGLLFVLPIAGHATWHLYRKAISTI
ncbi:DUF2189 domain-containing protein [Peteryoungia desertarenae]|uniref:DUF2189 domain-containing protein n=1 Tax=Peteryoungia desertarenae TaxID=1813451 RepID=A0ABX6QRD1_9HYPH|nr:DUF2189 domain-containing protein [Peteryoungia desertarenae]QLF70822.1 DUF2189 domain-containing protein [Peteryoungia desertarenae]